ncbi:hypothetical protein N1851_029059 [Merluccius polli]|uniref:Reverse transcriptase n=1 Tax=Merluccius polli TaxID=89951 RepID=A0AA47NR15_MERPO|nr:hypothetical protein N1851_029059 [Merluccius polli]
MKCLAQENSAQRTGSTPGETQEEPGPETTHRAQNLQVLDTPTPSRVVQYHRIKWPQANQHKLWQQFDEDTSGIINATAKGDAEGRLKSLTTIITSFGAERFGVEEPKSSKPTYTNNRRADKIHQLRKELRSLAKQFKTAAEAEKPPLAELRHTIRKKLTTLRRAEWHRRRRTERARKRSSFIANPFGFTKRLLGQKRSGRLDCSKEEVDDYLFNTLRDPDREQELGPQKALLDIPAPLVEFNTSKPTWKEVQEVVTSARASSAPGPTKCLTRWILQGLEKLIGWARMSFKPTKSRSMVLKRGKVVDKFRFLVDGTAIPTITEKPVTSLGKIFDCSLRDTASIQATIKKLETWLSAVDKSGLPGRFKAWLYQHGILPRILWPLLVYEVTMSTVETLERKISSYLRRWLGLPRSLTSAALYGRSNKLQLPFCSLEEEFRVSRTREALVYRDSSDTRVAAAGIVVRTGRKFKAQEGLELAESRLRHKAMVGMVAIGRAGLGAIPQPRYDRAQGKERGDLVLEEVRAGVEDVRTSRMVSMRQQGASTRWEGALERKLTWNDIWKAEPQRIKFMVQAVYDVLPSPANLHVWGKSDLPTCPLCPGRGTLEHIMSSCPAALGGGRYRWRHDQVLKAVAETISSAVANNKHASSRKSIPFVKAGEKPRSKPTPSASLLSSASDWELRVELIEECRRRGWKARCEPIEVGCRGFAARSLCRAYSLLGISGAAKRRAIKSATEASERASRWIWIKRSEKWANAAGTQAGD